MNATLHSQSVWWTDLESASVGVGVGAGESDDKRTSGDEKRKRNLLHVISVFVGVSVKEHVSVLQPRSRCCCTNRVLEIPDIYLLYPEQDRAERVSELSVERDNKTHAGGKWPRTWTSICHCEGRKNVTFKIMPTNTYDNGSTAGNSNAACVRVLIIKRDCKAMFN